MRGPNEWTSGLKVLIYTGSPDSEGEPRRGLVDSPPSRAYFPKQVRSPPVAPTRAGAGRVEPVFWRQILNNFGRRGDQRPAAGHGGGGVGLLVPRETAIAKNSNREIDPQYAPSGGTREGAEEPLAPDSSKNGPGRKEEGGRYIGRPASDSDTPGRTARWRASVLSSGGMEASRSSN